MNTMFAAVDELMPQLITWRRMLHQNPELSHREHRTARFVADQLRSFGIEVTEGVGAWNGGPGAVIGRLTGALPGPNVGLRADMDALPLQDEKNVAYRSTVDGVMHACGHDAHTATLLGVAKILSEHRNQIKGRITFVFQHAEETHPGGADMIIKAGAVDDVDVMYGVHLWSLFPVGQLHCAAGPIMATAEEFVVHIQGRGGHAALPHQSIDALLVGAHTVVNLQTIVSRAIDPIESCVVTVGLMQAGTNFNVIADSCVLKGTVRTFTVADRDLAERKVREIVKQTAEMFGAIATVDYKGGFAAVVNDEAEYERFRAVTDKWFPPGQSHKLKKMMAGEDFAFYLQKMPGVFIFVGARNEAKGCHYEHHHNRFDIDEDSMNTAAKILLAMAVDYLESK